MRKIVLLAAPPATGKTTIIEEMDLHSGNIGVPWIYLDNEWIFTMEMRVLCSEESGKPLNSPEFVKTYNLRQQLIYQQLCRNLAAQNVNVLMPGPFEDLLPMIGDKPLYEKMRDEDFKYFDFRVFQLLLWPETDESIDSTNIIGHPAMEPVEAEVQRRLKQRGFNNENQQKLDADKLHRTYYAERAAKVLATHEAYPNEIRLFKVDYRDPPEEVADKLREAIFEL